MNPSPVVLGLTLCEQVIVEETTRNVTLVNCFTHRTVNQIPSEPVSFVAFATLCDANGPITLEVVLERLDTLDLVRRITVASRFPDPLHTIRCIARIRNVSFPVPGHYQVLLFADKELIAQRKLVVVEKD